MGLYEARIQNALLLIDSRCTIIYGGKWKAKSEDEADDSPTTAVVFAKCTAPRFITNLERVTIKTSLRKDIFSVCVGGPWGRT